MQNLPKIPQLIDLEILPWFNKLAMAEDCVKQVQKDLSLSKKKPNTIMLSFFFEFFYILSHSLIF